MKRKTCVWVDTKKAGIVILEGENISTQIIYSSIVTRERIAGQGKLYTRFGNQFMNFEKKKQNRFKNEVKLFCKKVIERIKGSDEVVLFGPAGMKKVLEKFLRQDIRFSKIPIGIKSSGVLTENQIISRAKHYYNW